MKKKNSKELKSEKLDKETKNVYFLDLEAKSKEIDNLKKQIKYHKHRYYVLNDPEISDKEYDNLVKKLNKLEGNLGNFKSENDSTTPPTNTSISKRVKQYLEKCKEKLIDLSRRNHLLYFSPSKKSSLKIYHPDAISLFNRLVVDEKSLEIWFPDEKLSEEDADFEFTPKEIKKLNVRESQIVCNLKDRKEIEYILKNLYRRSVSDYNERGVRILYVAFGLLTWKEIETSENVTSPLILVPVELRRESIRYPFSLFPIGEDVILNPALRIKLQKDFKINLPDISNNWEEKNLLEFFNSIKKLVTDTSWSITPEEVYISLFSFFKLVMYNDLDRNEEVAGHHRIVSALGEGTIQKDMIVSDLPSEEKLDEIQQPLDTFQILDADSSQQLCIQYALRGQSFVIQGPPGTGKSQTIANIIAEFIARGKSVLFVSEKMAALEVVYKRLKEVGLADFCLELHSYKANKREVVSELNRCLGEIPVPQKALSTSEFEKISLLKNYLNKYVKALHKEYGPMKWSAYRIIGNLCKLQEVPYIPVCDKSLCGCPSAGIDPETLTPKEFFNIEDLVKKLKNVWKVAKEGDNFSWKDFRETKFSFALKREMADLLEKIVFKLETLLSVTNEYIKYTELQQPESLSDIAWLVRTSEFLKDILRPEPHWLTCPDVDFDELIKEANRFKEIYDYYHKSKKLFETYNEDFFNLDLEKISTRFNQTYCKWYFRWFNPLYYWDKYLIVRNTKAHKFPLLFINDLQEALELKQKINDIKNILPNQVPNLTTNEGIVSFEIYINKEEKLQEQFGSYFKGLDTDWGRILLVLKWSREIRQLFIDRKMPINFIKLICKETNITPVCKKFIQSYLDFKKYIDELEEKFESTKEFNKMKIKELENKLQHLINNIDDLQIWLDFKSIKRQFDTTKFKSFFQHLVEKAPPEDILVDVYHKSVYQTWLENILTKDSILGEFQRKYHDQEISEFKSLDIKLVDFSPLRVIEKATDYRPSTIVDINGSEVSILKHESAKIKRHMPIRVLLKKIPNLLSRLKPCLMMSPISVSQYLDPKVQFDLVIFDEASQICPEDSIGSIYRGKQLIVVGDDKQLPPTPFFQKQEAMGEEEIDWDNINDEVSIDVESILDQCVIIGLPQKMLRWHYRSKYESLIAFSNRWFYKNDLVTFPPPLETKISKVELKYVPDGIYDRGGKRDNKREANIVADLVFEHFKDTPHKTIGVVTFSLPQMVTILDEIERRLKENPEWEKFFKEDRLQGFFVKNLENVQGDERDVIIFSIGYGKDEHGNMTMNFGPLNKPGGERRLNVAITRAREKVVVVSSIKSGDIDLKKTKAPGILHLWRYLDYAERGRVALELKAVQGGEPESPLEEDVANEIRKLGYEVILQVGCSCYRIDIGVVDPVKPGHFLLGVECDGATYHSCYTARDRDRLRQQVLKKLGWQIHRIWSLDWLFRRKSEIELLKQAIEKAKERSIEGESSSRIDNPPFKVEKNIKREKVEVLSKIPGTSPYKACYLESIPKGETLNSQIEKIVKRIIEIEAPIHIKLVAERTAKILNFQCTSYFFQKVTGIIENLANNLFDKKLFKIKGDFLYPFSTKHIPVRIPIPNFPETFRPIEWIPPEEIQNAMVLIIKNSFGISMEDLITATADLFGVKRKMDKTRNILFDICKNCIKKGYLDIKKNK